MRTLTSMAVVLLLAACGGGSGGSSGGSGGSTGGTGTGSATPQGGFVLPTGSNKSTVIAENGGNGGNTVVRYSSGGSASVTFGGVTRTWRGEPTVVGDVEATESTDGRTVVVTARGAASNLQYTSYGIWLQSSATTVLAGSSNQLTSVSSFVIGDPTPVDRMPGAGIGSYRGQAVAVEIRGDQAPRTSSGPFNASVDFGAGRLSATADLGGAGVGRVTMNGLAIDGNQFSGSASADGHVGSVKGGFAGPTASELGGTFQLNGSSQVHGAFAGSSR